MTKNALIFVDDASDDNADLPRSLLVVGGISLLERQLRQLNRQVLQLFEEVDVYLTPVMGTAPPRIGHIDPVNLEPRELNRRQVPRNTTESLNRGVSPNHGMGIIYADSDGRSAKPC